MEYDHYLLTKGFGIDGGRQSLVPLLLLHVEAVPTSEKLREAIEQEIDKRIRVFLPPDPSPVEYIKAASRGHIADMLSNLWLRRVRIRPNADSVLPTESFVTWILFSTGRLPPSFQGPSDGVIPPANPCTIWLEGSAKKFELIYL